MKCLGKNWKIQKTATSRTQQPKQLRKNWDQRSKERARNDATKTLEKQLKADKQAEKDVCIITKIMDFRLTNVHEI